jgi:hypothetical protein
VISMTDTREDRGARKSGIVYDVALSFAGEDRKYVQKVANFLVRTGLRTFYDQHETIQLWGKNLYDHLNAVYSDKARFVVIFISKSYKAKLWTDHERRSAQARAFRERREYILPARFDSTKLPGIFETVGYVDLRTLSPNEFAELIRKKCDSTAAYTPAELERGFHALSQENIDRIGASGHLKSGDTVITQVLTILPLTKRLREYEFYHWQAPDGRIALLRCDVLQLANGNVVSHSAKIVERTATSLRVRLRFNNLGRGVPLKLIFELRAENYFPDILKGQGYTEFLTRYSVDAFSYELVTPNQLPFTGFVLHAIHNKNKKTIRPQARGGELMFRYGPVVRRTGDAFRFNVSKTRMPKIR